MEAAMQDGEPHGADIDVPSQVLADEALDRGYGSEGRYTGSPWRMSKASLDRSRGSEG